MMCTAARRTWLVGLRGDCGLGPSQRRPFREPAWCRPLQPPSQAVLPTAAPPAPAPAFLALPRTNPPTTFPWRRYRALLFRPSSHWSMPGVWGMSPVSPAFPTRSVASPILCPRLHSYGGPLCFPLAWWIPLSLFVLIPEYVSDKVASPNQVVFRPFCVSAWFGVHLVFLAIAWMFDGSCARQPEVGGAQGCIPATSLDKTTVKSFTSPRQHRPFPTPARDTERHHSSPLPYQAAAEETACAGRSFSCGGCAVTPAPGAITPAPGSCSYGARSDPFKHSGLHQA